MDCGLELPVRFKLSFGCPGRGRAGPGSRVPRVRLAWFGAVEYFVAAVTPRAPRARNVFMPLRSALVPAEGARSDDFRHGRLTFRHHGGDRSSPSPLLDDVERARGAFVHGRCAGRGAVLRS